MLGDPLAALPETIRLARYTMAVIRQNILFFAFGLNGLAIVLAGIRILGPVSAAIVHQVGSLLVLLSAIRILGFERWHTFAPVRMLDSIAKACRRFRPRAARRWIRAHGRMVTGCVLALAFLAYSVSGIVMVGPDQIGLARRFGRYEPPPLRPGLHLRWPAPVESVALVEPDRSRIARVGLRGPAAPRASALGWSASHGAPRDESALFFTGDENLVELAAVVEYRFTEASLPALLFGVTSAADAVTATAEGVMRENVGRTSQESILVSGRRELEAGLARQLQDRLRAMGLALAIDRVRVVDAHPPREVVPAYRDVSAAVSDAERSLNLARGEAAKTQQFALAEAASIRDEASTKRGRLIRRAQGEKAAFLSQAAAHAGQPALTEFRLLWDTLARTLAGRPKLILDRKAGGRRHLWLADPESFSPAFLRDASGGPASSEIKAREPDD
jgi:Cu+-exporting ATPase